MQVKGRENSDFQSQFSMSKINGILLFFFIEEFKIQKEAQLLLLTYFHNFDFQFTLLSISVPNISPSKPKRTKMPRISFLQSKLELSKAYSSLNSANLSLLSEVTLRQAHSSPRKEAPIYIECMYVTLFYSTQCCSTFCPLGN